MNLKRKISLALVLVILGTMIFGNAALAKWYEEGKDAHAEELEIGDMLEDNIHIIIPEEYKVSINGAEFVGTYSIKDDFFSGNLGDVSVRNVVVRNYAKDDTNKTIEIVLADMRQCSTLYYPNNTVKGGYKSIMIVRGDTVTLTAKIPDEYLPFVTSFQKWIAIKSWEYDSVVDIGLNEEELSQMTITFRMPDEWFMVDYSYTIDTISGNAPRYGSHPLDTSYLNPEADIEVDIKPSGNDGSSTNNTPELKPAIPVNKPVPNKITFPNGQELTSQSDVYNVAHSMAAVITATSQAVVDNAAGLTQEEIKNGTKSRFYIGDIYKPEVKNTLKNAAAEVKGTIISMIDMDLYMIGKSGINAVRTVTEPVKMILALPESQVMEGKTYSIICVVNGQLIEMPDTDVDPGTITIDTTHFGPCAVIWK